MGKMDLIQTCLNDRSLEANLSCFPCACLLRKPRSVPPARGGARPRGCFLRDSHVAFGKPPGQNPAGGGSARGHPKKEPTAEESWGKLSCPQRTTARKEPELGSERFYKTSCHHRGGSGSAGGFAGAWLWARHPPASSGAALTQEPTNYIVERQLVPQAAREGNAWHKKIKSEYWNCCKITNNLRASWWLR